MTHPYPAPAAVETDAEDSALVDDERPTREAVAQAAGEALARRDAALLENVARHLRLHPQAQVHDDRGRLRDLSQQEAERIAQVTLRAARAWLIPVAQEGDDSRD